MNICALTSVSLHTEKLYPWRISTIASFIITRANRIPIQFLGPAPKGMNVYGSIDSLFFLLNLKVHTNMLMAEMRCDHGFIWWLVLTCKSFQYLSGLNSSGSGHTLGSLWMGHVGTMIIISLGITMPFISTDALATRSRRAAMGYNRRDSLMTLSRYSICISAWYWTGAYTHRHTDVTVINFYPGSPKIQ